MNRCSHLRQQVICLLMCLMILSTGCQPAGTAVARQTLASDGWTMADLRILEPAGQVDPGLDLIAASTRRHETDVQIRVDLLDSASIFDYDLYIALDTRPGGTTRLPIQAESGIEWDVLLVLRAGERARVVTTTGETLPEVLPRVARDSLQDTAVISINQAHFPGDAQRFSFQAFTASAGSLTAADSLAAARSDDHVTRRASLLLAFWDTLPADTPAQTLRRWDGAHTGPSGGRNGLRHLLLAVEDYHVPVALLDLKTPETLSAIEYLDQLDWVQNLAGRDLLLLPDVWESSQGSAAVSSAIVQRFGIDPSPIVYGNIDLRQTTGYQAAFARLSAPARLGASQGVRLVPLPGSPATAELSPQAGVPDEASPEGPSLDLRRELLRTAAADEAANLVVAGGSLMLTTWADFQAAGPTLAYFANHPWVRPLSAPGVLTTPAGSEPADLACADLLCYHQSGMATGTQASLSTDGVQPAGEWTALPGLTGINRSDPLIELAARMVSRLSTPSASPELTALRSNYLGQVESLKLALAWSLQPAVQADCSTDADRDGTADCVLASDTIFAIVQPRGARLTFVFYRDAAGVHQIVAPASQFSVGISDPLDWDLTRGAMADPNEIPGAFTEPDEPLRIYQPAITGGSLVFTAPDGAQKTYSLLPAGIRMEYSGAGSVEFMVPLAVDPQARYQKGWPAQYTAHQEGSRVTWGTRTRTGINITLTSSGQVELATFLDSLAFIPQPEDPNRDYPVGHYLPFPLALATLRGADHLIVDLTVSPAASGY